MLQDLINILVVIIIKSSLLSNIIGISCENTNISEKVLNKIERSKQYLECLSNKTSMKILAIISLNKICTASKLRDLVGISSRDTITYYCLKARNAGLIDIITNKDDKHQMLHSFWKIRVQNTHDNTRFFIATQELINVRKILCNEFDKLIDANIINQLDTQGKAVDEHIKKHTETNKSKEIEMEKIALNTIGACNECGKALSKTHLQTKQCKFIDEKIYCKSCYREMSRNGKLAEILRNIKSDT